MGAVADGDADAGDHVDLGVGVADRLGHRLAKLEREHLGRGLGRRLLAHHHELVAAEAGNRVGDACGLAEPGGQGGEHHVTGGVAVGVVDDGEAVDVDDQDGEPGRLAAGDAGQRTLDPVVEQRPVGQAGQGVVHGGVAERLVRPYQRGDVVVDHEGAARGQTTQAYGVGGALALDGARHVVRGDLAVHDPAQPDQGLAGPGVVAPGGEDRGVARADAGSDRAGSGTGEVAGDRVGPSAVGRDDGAGPVEHGDGLAEGVEDAALHRVAAGQGVDGALAFHGVADGASQDLAREVAEQRVVLGAFLHREDAEALVMVVVDHDQDRYGRGRTRAGRVPAPERWHRRGAGSAAHTSAARRPSDASSTASTCRRRNPSGASCKASRTTSAEAPPSTSSSVGAAREVESHLVSDLRDACHACWFSCRRLCQV